MIPLEELMAFLFLLPILKYLLTLLDYYNVLSPEALLVHSALGLSGCWWRSWASYQLCYCSPGPPTLWPHSFNSHSYYSPIDFPDPRLLGHWRPHCSKWKRAQLPQKSCKKRQTWFVSFIRSPLPWNNGPHSPISSWGYFLHLFLESS